jgi:hypothetical protein
MLRSNIRPPYEEGDDLILASRGRKYAGVCSRGKWQARSAAAMSHPFLLERTPALRDKCLARSPVLEAVPTRLQALPVRAAVLKHDHRFGNLLWAKSDSPLRQRGRVPLEMHGRRRIVGPALPQTLRRFRPPELLSQAVSDCQSEARGELPGSDACKQQEGLGGAPRPCFRSSVPDHSV